MNAILIAESGGTKTDWCLVKNGVVSLRKTTNSLHPNNWSEVFWSNLKLELSELAERDTHIQLYIAGCHSESKRRIFQDRLQHFGFSKVEVYSDLIAAGKATACNHSWVIILGTGSVMFEYEAGVIKELIGGKGNLLGDEGSGYYFGKLLLHAASANKLTEQQESYLRKRVDLISLTELLDSGEGKFEIAELSKIVGGSDLFHEYHRQNLAAFIETHQIDEKQNPLYVVGSYGYYNRDLIKAFFSSQKVTIEGFIERPIDVLVEQTVGFDE